MPPFDYSRCPWIVLAREREERAAAMVFGFDSRRFKLLWALVVFLNENPNCFVRLWQRRIRWWWKSEVVPAFYHLRDCVAWFTPPSPDHLAFLRHLSRRAGGNLYDGTAPDQAAEKRLWLQMLEYKKRR